MRFLAAAKTMPTVSGTITLLMKKCIFTKHAVY